MDEEKRRERFIEIFTLAKDMYEDTAKRLAGEEWKKDWQTLMSTIMSAQNRDSVTIPTAEKLFDTYPTLEEFAHADLNDIRDIIDNINYYKNKSKYMKKTAKTLLDEHDGNIPDTMDDLLYLTGVGRKTANLILTEVHDKPAICVDTHVHRISNVFDIVDTEKPDETEQELRRIAPKKYWKEINRYFVLWGQDVSGRDKEKLLERVKD